MPLVLVAVAVMEFDPIANLPAGIVAVNCPDPAAVSVAVAITIPFNLNFTVPPVTAVTFSLGESLPV